MIDELNKAAREATERDLDGWHLTSGTPPGEKKGVMLCMMSGSGKPYAIGCGKTDLEAANALVSDMTKRARRWLELRRTVRVWRDALRVAAGESRAERSKAFLSAPTEEWRDAATGKKHRKKVVPKSEQSSSSNTKRTEG